MVSKAHVVVGIMPYIIHFIPMRIIVQKLVLRGYEVTVITGECFRNQVVDLGAHFFMPPGWEHMNDEWALGVVKSRAPGTVIEGANANSIDFFIKPMLAEFEAIQSVLANIAAEEPTTPVVVLAESSFGAFPLRMGAAGLQPKGVISIGLTPILAMSVDTAPAFGGILPDDSLKGRERNIILNEKFLKDMEPAHLAVNKILEQLGARKTNSYRHNTIMEVSNIYLQLCPPSLEYPRSDVPSTLRFTGGLPRTKSDSSGVAELPGWWEDVKTNHEKRRIVAVSQGTVNFNHTHLIIPTLVALKDQDDVLVIVALGKKGAKLPEGYVCPANARVADWIPYDDLLPLSDVFVTNGGYGEFQNSLARGVPIVIAAPQFADKRDVADRVEWSGTGINLKTGTPTVEAVRTAVAEVLRDHKYKRRALEIQAEIKTYDPMEVIARAIDEVAAL